MRANKSVGGVFGVLALAATLGGQAALASGGIYVDSIAGDDTWMAKSPAADIGGSRSNPLKTLGASVKLLTSSQTAIYLRCGDAWSEHLSIPPNIANVSVDHYGSCTGNNEPAIRPLLENIGNWRRVSNTAIYSASAPGGRVRAVLSGTSEMPIAAYPPNGFDAGYYVQSVDTGPNGPMKITVTMPKELPSSDVAGTGMTIRSDFYLDHVVVGKIQYTAVTPRQVTAVITLQSGQLPVMTPDSGWGFYLDGKAWMVTPGTWCFDAASNLLFVWMQDGGSPTGLIRVPDMNTPTVVADNTAGVNIRHLDVSYGSAAISARNSTNLVIEEVRISGADLAAIDISADRTRTDLTSLNGPLIANNVITGIRRNGVFADSRLGTKIVGNTIRSVGTGIYAIAPSAWTSTQYAATPMFSAVRAYAALDLTVNNNSITDVGNVAIFGKRLPDQPVNQNGMTFTGNYISSSCVILDDCGAIYLSSPDRRSLNAIVSHNFVDGTRDKSKIGSASLGRPASSHGESNSAIYLDDSANGVAVGENTIVSADFGVLIHNGFNNSIDKNRFWGNRHVDVYLSEFGGAPYSVNHNRITDNEFAQSQNSVIYQFATANSRDPGYTRAFATYSRNEYFLSGGVVARGVGDLSFGYDVAQWQNAGFEDLTSSLFVQSPMKIYFAGNRSSVDIHMDCGAIADNTNSCAGYFFLHDRSPVAWPLHLPALSSYLLVR